MAERVVEPDTRDGQQHRRVDVVGRPGPAPRRGVPPRRSRRRAPPPRWRRPGRSDARRAAPAATVATSSTAAPTSSPRCRRIRRAWARARTSASRRSDCSACSAASRKATSVSVRVRVPARSPLQGLGSAGPRGTARCPAGPAGPRRRPRALRWCRIRCPSTSSSSQARSRGQARASASWAISTTPASLVTSRDVDQQVDELLVLGSVGRAAVAAPGCGPARPRPRPSPAAAPGRGAGAAGRARRWRRPSRPTGRPRRGCHRVAAYPATVSVRPSRRFQVSMRAWDSSGSAPGVPSTSPTSRSTSPASISSPDCRAGASMASRSACSLIATQQMQAALDQPGEAGVGRHLGQPVGAHRHDHGPGPRRPSTQRREELAPLGLVVAQREDLLALVDHQHRTPAPGPAAAISDRIGCSPG